MEKRLFDKRILNPHKAFVFGAKKVGENYLYETDILDGQFRLLVSLSTAGNADTSLTEKDSGEEYVLYKTNAAGAFVGSVREAVEAVLMEVAENCYDMEIFRPPQTKEVTDYVRGKYGDELEFLWKRSPDNAILRRKDTAKWYAAILTVAKSKLGLDSDDAAEIINLRVKPEKMGELLKNDNYYPGWHMNKKSWYTIILDGSVDTEEVYRRVDESYLLAI